MPGKARPRAEIITFKADRALSAAMRGVPNRSAFIRDAILGALENACPLCRGTGVLTADQKRHWARFRADHRVAECGSCRAVHLVCARPAAGAGRAKRCTP